MVYDVLYPPPPDIILEDPSIEATGEGIRNGGPIIDDLTGFAMTSDRVTYQNGLRKDAWDLGSVEQREVYKGTPRSWQTRSFGAGDNG